jgi:hypothetical protein
MGGGRLSDSDWAGYSSAHIAGKTADKIYTSKKLENLLDPKGVTFRESCDSPDNPQSNAIIVALDVTGSMAPVLEQVASNLGVLVSEIYARKPVTDPHLMFMGVGDVECDRAPIQVTQFEADIRIAEQLQKIFFEQGGGGNDHESYILPWYFAALHTKIDCFEKRGKKGFLFTIGDECPTPSISKEAIREFIGDTPQTDYSAKELLDLVSKQYNVYHLIIEEGNYCARSGALNEVVSKWTALLGQRAIRISDHSKVAEVIVSILEREAGKDKEEILKSWSKETALVVSKAIGGLTTVEASEGGLVKL